MWPSNATLRPLLKRNESSCSHKYISMNLNFHSSSVHNSGIEQKQPKWPSMDREIKCVNQQNGMSLDHTKKRSTEKRLQRERNGPWNHYAKWKESDTEDHILYNSIYVKRPQHATSQRRKIVRAAGRRAREATSRWTWSLRRGDHTASQGALVTA